MRTVLRLILRAAGNSGNVWTAVTEKIEIKTENPTLRNHGLITGWRILLSLSKCMKTIVGSDEIGRLICTVSRMRSNQTELRAYMDGCGFNSTGCRVIRAMLAAAWIVQSWRRSWRVTQ